MGSTTYNFNHPSNAENQLRLFDVDANSLNLDLFSLTLHHDPQKGEPGFRADIDAGPYIPVAMHPIGLPTGLFYLLQAYLSYIAKIGNGIRFDAGEFFSPIGFEQVERFDEVNWNASHSFLFSYALPFTNTGLRVMYPFNNELSATAAIVNGWDNAIDDNRAKTEILQLRWKKGDTASIELGMITGLEKPGPWLIIGSGRPGDTSGNRMLFDLNGSINYSNIINSMLGSDLPPWVLGAEIVYAQEANDRLSLDYISPPLGTATWSGAAIYAHFSLFKSVSINLRDEFFDDTSGIRVRVNYVGVPKKLNEQTYTIEWRPDEHLYIYGEWRSDNSTEAVFDRSGTLQRSQHTAALEVIYSF